jgi:hypothetical protein
VRRTFLERDSSTRARLLEKRGRTLLAAPPGAPPMDAGLRPDADALSHDNRGRYKIQKRRYKIQDTNNIQDTIFNAQMGATGVWLFERCKCDIVCILYLLQVHQANAPEVCWW